VDGIAYQSGTTFPGLNPDNYDVTVQDLTTTCVSAVTMLTVDPVPSNPAAPSASVTAQPDCAVTTGTIEVTAPLGANYEYSVDGITYQSNTTFSGLNPGNYDVTVQDLNTTCISAVTTLTIDPVPSNPATPSANVTVQPDCINTTGEIQVTTPLGANYSYSIDGVTYQVGPDFAGLTPGSYDVTVLDANTSCVSSATTLTVDPIPSAPSAPTASVTVQPSCTDATGTIEVTAPLGANYEYSADGLAYQLGTTFSGLNPGNYDVTVQDNTNGCESAAITLTVNTNPGAPATPTASVTVQPDCNTPTGTIEVTTPLGANLEYSIDGSTYQPGTTFSGLAPGNYNVSVIDNSSMCVSATLTLAVTALPTAPTASVTVQPDCITPTGTIEVTAPLGANYEYSIDGSTYQSGTTFPGLAPGSYDVTVQDINTGCVSSATTLNVVADPITPVANVSVQPDCSISTGTIVISDPIGANYLYSVDNANYQNGTIFSGLMPGNYDVTVQNTSTGCISAPLTLTVNAAPLVPQLDLISDTTVCDTYVLETIEGTDLTGNEAYYSDWPSTGGTILTGAINGTQTVFVYDGAGACADSTSFAVTVDLTPTLTVLNPTAVCEPNTVDISGSASTDVGTLQWYTDAGLATVVADPTQVTAGTYYVESDNNGCTFDDEVTVTVNPLPAAPQAGTDTTYCAGDNFELLTVSGTGGTYNWYDMSDNYLGTGSTFAPFDVLGSTHYHVTETVNGCEGPFTMVIISVEGCDDEPVCGELFVPNAFTPNTDTNNDSFGVSVLDNACIEDMNLKVFDRWGKVVFSSTDPNERWDGTFKDEELDQAVFHYILDIKLFSESEYRLVKGNVTLIR
jgi:gliding motility-associated-like protein